MTNRESALYNSIIEDFYNTMNVSIRPKGYFRLGQAFYNYGYEFGIFKGSYPELFYCEDNNKAQKMIETCLCEYIKRYMKKLRN